MIPIDIFKPLMTGDPVRIATYGLSDTETMANVLEGIQAKGSYLLFGYSKLTHHPGRVFNLVKEYSNLGFNVRVLPNCHVKLWVTETHGYVGSCNFVQNTLNNYMHRVTRAKILTVFEHYWRPAHDPFRRGTNLMLLPPAREEYTQ